MDTTSAARQEHARELSRQQLRSRAREHDQENAARLLNGTLVDPLSPTGATPKTTPDVASPRNSLGAHLAGRGTSSAGFEPLSPVGPELSHSLDPSESMMSEPTSPGMKVKRLAPREAAERALAKLQMAVQLMNLEREHGELADVRAMARKAIPPALDLREEMMKRYVRQESKPSQYFASSLAQMNTIIDNFVDDTLPSDAALDEEEAQMLKDTAEALRRKKMEISRCHCRERLDRFIVDAERTSAMKARAESIKAFARVVQNVIPAIRALELNLEERDKSIRELTVAGTALKRQLGDTSRSLESVEARLETSMSTTVGPQLDMSIMREAQYLDREFRLYNAIKRIPPGNRPETLDGILLREFHDGEATKSAPWVRKFLRRTRLIHRLRERCARLENQLVQQHDHRAVGKAVHREVQTLKEEDIVGTKAWERKHGAARTRSSAARPTTAADPIAASLFNTTKLVRDAPMTKLPIRLQDCVNDVLRAATESVMQLDQTRVDTLQAVVDMMEPRLQARAMQTCFVWQSQLEGALQDIAKQLAPAVTALVSCSIEAIGNAKREVLRELTPASVTPQAVPAAEPIPGPPPCALEESDSEPPTPPQEPAQEAPRPSTARARPEVSDCNTQTEVYTTYRETQTRPIITYAVATNTAPLPAPGETGPAKADPAKGKKGVAASKTSKGPATKATDASRPTPPATPGKAVPTSVAAAPSHSPASLGFEMRSQEVDATLPADFNAERDFADRRKLLCIESRQASENADEAGRVLFATSEIIHDLRGKGRIKIPQYLVDEVQLWRKTDAGSAAPTQYNALCQSLADTKRATRWLETVVDCIEASPSCPVLNASEQAHPAAKPSLPDIRCQSTSMSVRTMTGERSSRATSTPPPPITHAALCIRCGADTAATTSHGFEVIDVKDTCRDAFHAPSAPGTPGGPSLGDASRLQTASSLARFAEAELTRLERTPSAAARDSDPDADYSRTEVGASTTTPGPVGVAATSVSQGATRESHRITPSDSLASDIQRTRAVTLSLLSRLAEVAAGQRVVTCVPPAVLADLESEMNSTSRDAAGRSIQPSEGLRRVCRWLELVTAGSFAVSSGAPVPSSATPVARALSMAPTPSDQVLQPEPSRGAVTPYQKHLVMESRDAPPAGGLGVSTRLLQLVQDFGCMALDRNGLSDALPNATRAALLGPCPRTAAQAESLLAALLDFLSATPESTTAASGIRDGPSEDRSPAPMTASSQPVTVERTLRTRVTHLENLLGAAEKAAAGLAEENEELRRQTNASDQKVADAEAARRATLALHRLKVSRAANGAAAGTSDSRDAIQASTPPPARRVTSVPHGVERPVEAHVASTLPAPQPDCDIPPGSRMQKSELPPLAKRAASLHRPTAAASNSTPTRVAARDAASTHATAFVALRRDEQTPGSVRGWGEEGSRPASSSLLLPSSPPVKPLFGENPSMGTDLKPSVRAGQLIAEIEVVEDEVDEGPMIDGDLLDVVRGLSAQEKAVVLYELLGARLHDLHVTTFRVVRLAASRLKLPAIASAIDPLSSVPRDKMFDSTELLSHDTLVLRSLAELMERDSQSAVSKMQRTFDRIKCRIERRNVEEQIRRHTEGTPSSPHRGPRQPTPLVKQRDIEFLQRQKQRLEEHGAWLEAQREKIREEQQKARKEWSPWRTRTPQTSLPLITMRSIRLRRRSDIDHLAEAPSPYFTQVDDEEDPYIALFKTRVERWLRAKKALFERRRKYPCGGSVAHPVRATGGTIIARSAVLVDRFAPAASPGSILFAKRHASTPTPSNPTCVAPKPTLPPVKEPRVGQPPAGTSIEGATFVELTQRTFDSLRRRL
jgi:hypothetical protein